MKKYTPGPWKQGKDPSNIISDSEKKVVCEVNPISFNVADAYLISAAPDMLEALIEIHNMMVDMGPTNLTAEIIIGVTYPIVKKARNGDNNEI